MKRRFRFRLLSLLLLTAIVAGVLAWWVQPRQVTAKAQFLIRDQPRENQLNPFRTPRLTEREIRNRRLNMAAKVTSSDVLQAALMDPAVQKTYLVKVDDPIQWLKDYLEVEYEGESELLTLRLRDTETHSTDLLTIVNAICQAYSADAVMESRLERMKRQHALKHIQSSTLDSLRRKLVQMEELRAANPENIQPKVDILLLQAEVEQLFDFLGEVGIRLQDMEIELTGPDDISLVEPPHISTD